MIYLATAIECLGVFAFTAWLFQYTENPWSLWCLILLFLVGYKKG